MFMKKKLLNLLIAVLSSFSLFINYKNIYLNKGNFINLNGIIIALIFSIILYLFIKNNKEKITKEDMILSGLFSIFLLIGQSYRSISSLSILFKNFTIKANKNAQYFKNVVHFCIFLTFFAQFKCIYIKFE